jgi:hypothetical protein
LSLPHVVKAGTNILEDLRQGLLSAPQRTPRGGGSRFGGRQEAGAGYRPFPIDVDPDVHRRTSPHRAVVDGAVVRRSPGAALLKPDLWFHSFPRTRFVRAPRPERAIIAQDLGMRRGSTQIDLLAERSAQPGDQ